MTIYSTTENILEKRKCEHILRETVLPKLKEMLETAGEIYGKETLESFESIVQEVLNAT